ncbi:M10 family metallopeptidase [Rhizobium sp. TH2]|uniref:M10 family metallopeptidase n=1 Tax=Rhizobium sp. TH2 TaxID=2775403 RepID=UPI0021579A50|nr:M10 family metallopeptidase [Rhizobium sp. TH2]UVC11624.1 M10 family metallopeptidase [Rhizobium sp. TH2]
MTARIDKDAFAAVDTARAATAKISKSNNPLADGVMSGYAWGGAITYAFPDAVADYARKYGEETKKDFGQFSSNQKEIVRSILDQADGKAANDRFSVEGFTKLDVKQGSENNATIRYADSNAANPTAYAYYPSSGATGRGGDVWFGDYSEYQNPSPGNYAYATILHETGHALGLKHGHDASNFDRIQTVLKGKYDSHEYSVMTYHSFAGQKSSGYTNEDFGYPQTYMMADIAALQHMYGADYTTNAGNTVYSWDEDSGDTRVNGALAIDMKPGANRIFATIWDGGGNDTYDLSAYSDRVVIDLRPGKSSVFSQEQLADLDAGGGHRAGGNIYNALLFKGDNRSLIENAVSGSGNDSLTGNNGGNYLNGNAGNDVLNGLKGTDTYHGGIGDDVFVFGRSYGSDTIDDFSNGEDRINLSGFNLDGFAELQGLTRVTGGNIEIRFASGEVLTLLSTGWGELDASDFIL